MPMKLRISVSFSAGFHRNTRAGKSYGHVLLTRKILIIRQSCYLVPRFVVPCSLFRKAVHFLWTYFSYHFAFLHRLITFVGLINVRAFTSTTSMWTKRQRSIATRLHCSTNRSEQPAEKFRNHRQFQDFSKPWSFRNKRSSLQPTAVSINSTTQSCTGAGKLFARYNIKLTFCFIVTRTGARCSKSLNRLSD